MAIGDQARELLRTTEFHREPWSQPQRSNQKDPQFPEAIT